MKNFLSRFKALPLKTRQLLSLGLILALFVGLPLFVWAITTQRFELRKRAQELPKPTPTEASSPSPLPNPCEGQPDGTSCAICPACTYSVPRCLAPCQVGTCQNQVCVPGMPTPTPTPYPNPCQGQPDGTSCTGGGCPGPLIGPGGRPIPCTRPVFFGVCQNQACIRTTPTPSTTSTPSLSCLNGDKGNLDCDAQGLINASDLSILLASWCPSCHLSGGPGSWPAGRWSPDLNKDGDVNTTDLSILLSNWKPY